MKNKNNRKTEKTEENTKSISKEWTGIIKSEKMTTNDNDVTKVVEYENSDSEPVDWYVENENSNENNAEKNSSLKSKSKPSKDEIFSDIEFEKKLKNEFIESEITEEKNLTDNSNEFEVNEKNKFNASLLKSGTSQIRNQVGVTEGFSFISQPDDTNKSFKILLLGVVIIFISGIVLSVVYHDDIMKFLGLKSESPLNKAILKSEDAMKSGNYLDVLGALRNLEDSLQTIQSPSFVYTFLAEMHGFAAYEFGNKTEHINAMEEYILKAEATRVHPDLFAAAKVWQWAHLPSYIMKQQKIPMTKYATPHPSLLFAAGAGYLKIDEKDKAIEMFNKVLEMEPDYLPAIKALGNLYVFKSDYNQAVIYFKRALSLNQLNIGSVVDYYTLLVKQDNYKKISIKKIDKLLTLAKEEGPMEQASKLHYVKGMLLEKIGEDTLASLEYQSAIHLNDKEPSFYLKLALIKERKHQLYEAANFFRMASLKIDSNDVSRFQILYHLAKNLIQLGEILESREILSKLKSEKGMVLDNINCLLANAYLRTGNTVSARDLFEVMKKIPAEFLCSKAGEIRVKIALKEFDDAQRLLLDSKEFFNKGGELLLLKGELFMAKGLYKQSYSHYKSVIKQFEKDKSDIIINDPSVIYLYAAEAARFLTKFKDAEKLLEKSLKINPNNIDSMNALAFLYIFTKQIKTGINQFRSLHAAVNHPNAAIKLARMMVENGDYSLAFNLIEKELKSARSNHSGLFMVRGYMNLKMENLDAALDDLRKSVDLNSMNEEAHLFLGDLYRRKEEYREATSEYLFALQIRPDYPEALYKYGCTLIEINKFGQGLEILKKAEEQRENNNNATLSEIYLYKGVAAWAMEELNNAKQYLIKSLHMNKTNVQTHYYLGRCFEEYGKKSTSYKYYQRAIELKPSYGPPWFYIGRIDYNNGRFKLAKKRLNTYIKIIGGGVEHELAKKMLAKLSLN